MGTTPVNRALGILSGRIDDYVFRVVEGKVIVARRSRGTTVPASDEQLATQDRFKKSVEYAKKVVADAALRKWYADRAAATGVSNRRLFGRIVSDFFRPPEIKKIDRDDYHRHIGDPIRIDVSDDWLVTAVSVQLSKQADGTLLEEGAATYDAPYWVYVAKTEQPADLPLAVTVTAADRPGNKSTEMMGIMN